MPALLLPHIGASEPTWQSCAETITSFGQHQHVAISAGVELDQLRLQLL
jgi:hypothetical protein